MAAPFDRLNHASKGSISGLVIRSIQHLIDRLAALGTLPTDTEEGRLQKALLTFIATLIGLAAVLWGSVYLFLGLYVAGAIPLGYALSSAISLTYLGVTKRYHLFRFIQLFLILILPFLLQWSLGGFADASAVIIWALLAPIGALMFSGPRPAVPWFIAFLALTVFSRVIHPWLPTRTAEVPFLFAQVFYVMNLGVVSSIIFVLLQFFVREREKAKARSEELLLNVLPAVIADRLKARPDTIADAFSEVSVLFADIVDFTRLSSNSSPHELVQLLNAVFTSFDHLAERHGLEKIKTIGDAYMVVGGLPTLRAGHLEAVAEMALDMLKSLKHHRRPDGKPLELRIGIHVGPAVAGVIGKNKFIYDLWGDTVNTASRMESHGGSGVIQVTEEVYRLLKDKYVFEKRGTIQVKGKGELTTYFLVNAIHAQANP